MGLAKKASRKNLPAELPEKMIVKSTKIAFSYSVKPV
jgi:hypothetical protein